MTPDGFLRLAWQTLVAPRQVAQLLMSLRLSHEALLIALALVVVLNAFVVGAMQAAGPGAAALSIGLGPIVFGALLAVLLVLSILLMTGVGQMFGGTARVEQVALLLVWLQALRALGQIAVALAATVSTALGSLFVVAIFAAGFWVLIHFLDVAHGFDNLLKALMVLILGSVALVIALTFLFTLFGLTPNGMAV